MGQDKIHSCSILIGGKKNEKPARDDIGLDGNILGLPPLIFFYYYLSIYCRSLFTYFDLIVKS